MPGPAGRWTDGRRRRSLSSKLDGALLSREELHHRTVLEALPGTAAASSTLGSEELPALASESSRVPVRALFENLEDGATVNEFLTWFPGVTREQVEPVLEHAERSLAVA